uniref:FER tyrosine kinase n=1 Tax=Equus caballus TaxID=9796 RepID=A0A9L0TKD6_HORSE
MGFGSDLKNSHEAVLKLQDWELRLLETVKKFMALRIKSDKEYASTLQNLCNQVDKESTIQMNYVSNVSKPGVCRFGSWAWTYTPLIKPCCGSIPHRRTR